MPALLRRYPIISGRGCVLDAAAHATSCQFSRLHCPVMMLCGSSDCTSRYIITLSASVSPNWEGSKPSPTLPVAINSELTLVFSQLGKLASTEQSERSWHADTATTSCLPFRPLLSIKRSVCQLRFMKLVVQTPHLKSVCLFGSSERKALYQFHS